MSEMAEKKLTNMPPNDKASFVIQVKCLQNATWQGTIQWLEGKKTQNFRSALELIRLMDNALGHDNDFEE